MSLINPPLSPSLNLSVDITLDPSTAHPRIILSEDGKQAQCGDCHQPVPDNPERYDRVVCVLARQGFSTGRHYWEVSGIRCEAMKNSLCGINLRRLCLSVALT